MSSTILIVPVMGTTMATDPTTGQSTNHLTLRMKAWTTTETGNIDYKHIYDGWCGAALNNTLSELKRTSEQLSDVDPESISGDLLNKFAKWEVMKAARLGFQTLANTGYKLKFRFGRPYYEYESLDLSQTNVELDGSDYEGVDQLKRAADQLEIQVKEAHEEAQQALDQALENNTMPDI